jgi:hypothetical protein
MSILEQQLELHFGDEYEENRRRAEHYVKYLISRPWWVDKQAMLNNEGPLYSMVNHCLLYIIEKGSVGDGHGAYATFLAEQYGTSIKANHATTLNDGTSMDTVRWSSIGLTETDSTSAALSGLTPYKRELVEQPLKTLKVQLYPRHKEFLEVYAKVGNVQEAGNLLGLSEASAWSLYRNARTSIRKQLKESP